MTPAEKPRLYREAAAKILAALEDEDDPLVWMSTIPAVLKEDFGFLWVGFYLARGGELRVGPYQGGLACLRIPFERGVCGAAARTGETMVVPDVHEFDGHIACDSRAESEIVVPVWDAAGRLRAVLDVDSEYPAHFDRIDQDHLEELVSHMQSLAWSDPN